MKVLVRHILLQAVIAFLFCNRAESQVHWDYQVGARTTFMVTTMGLAELGIPFHDVTPGGKKLAHSSSLFVLWPRGQHIRFGIENLVGNSYGMSGTGILFQGAGAILEYQRGSPWFWVAGVHGGGIIASATQDASEQAEDITVRQGTHYKGSGLFVAPQSGVGRLIGRYEVRVLAKWVAHVPGTDGLRAFDALYVGASVSQRR